MTQQLINVNPANNGASSDSPNAAFTKVNQNFTELYSGAVSATPASLVVGAATGGYLGPGTVNAVGLYVNDVAVLTSQPSSLVVGSPTGGNEGVGTVNATGLYVNGVAVNSTPTNLVFSGTDSGAVNAYVVALSGFPAALAAGLAVMFTPGTINTGPSTANIGGSGVQNIVNWYGAALTGGEINGETILRWNGTAWQLVSSATPPGNQRTAAEVAASITPTKYASGVGSFYRYGAKGGAGRTSDAVSVGAGVFTSASGGFAGAVAGMVAVVVDGGALRTGGRPAPLITTIASVQSNSQITLAAAPTAPASLSCTGTLNGTTSVTALSINPITSGVGLTRTWTVAGTNIPASDTVAFTSSSTLTLSSAATGSGSGVALTLTAPFEVCFGYDDSAAINAALSLPYPITDVKDNFLTTAPLGISASATGGAGSSNVNMPSALIIFAISNNTQHCVTASGVDRGNIVDLVGARYAPFTLNVGEFECCNSGLDGVYLQPSMYSNVRARVNNPFRNALTEWFTTGWQEGNLVDINCGRVGLHFHHKVNKGPTYQDLGGYRIMGRSPGLNSGYLGINVATQPDQCGGALRLYAGGGDAGINQNVWGGNAFCELDGERNVALSLGSDICNSPVTFVDASGTYVIEGAPSSPSNVYRSNTFSNLVIEDIDGVPDTRGGYQYYAMANATVQSTTITATSAGPWGQTYANTLMLAGADNIVRWPQRYSYPGVLLLGDQVSGGANTKFFQAGYLGLPQNAQTTNYTLVASDAGKVVVNSAGTQTIPQNTFAANNTVNILAFGGALSIAAGTGVTLYWYNGTTLVSTTPRTLANGAMATLFFQSPNIAVIYGNGIT